MREGYAVQILKWGEPILTIERTCLSGADLSFEDEDAIRDAAEHLKSFVGEPCDHEFAVLWRKRHRHEENSSDPNRGGL